MGLGERDDAWDWPSISPPCPYAQLIDVAFINQLGVGTWGGD